jgi:hypothetical protein
MLCLPCFTLYNSIRWSLLTAYDSVTGDQQPILTDDHLFRLIFECHRATDSERANTEGHPICS